MRSVTYKEPYNVNPKGWKEGDCVIRAISYASCESWDKVFQDLSNIALKKKRLFNSKQVYEEYLDNLGFVKHQQPKFDDGTKYTIAEINQVVDSRKYDVIISCAHHLTCIDNDCLIDTWSCLNKCVGNYWTRLKTGGARPDNKAKKKKTRIVL